MTGHIAPDIEVESHVVCIGTLAGRTPAMLMQMSPRSGRSDGYSSAETPSRNVSHWKLEQHKYVPGDLMQAIRVEDNAVQTARRPRMLVNSRAATYAFRRLPSSVTTSPCQVGFDGKSSYEVSFAGLACNEGVHDRAAIVGDVWPPSARFVLRRRFTRCSISVIDGYASGDDRIGAGLQHEPPRRRLRES